MTVVGDVLRFAGVPIRISQPERETFVTVKLRGAGAVQRSIASGKTPVAFTGYRVESGQFIYSRIDARNGAFALIPPSLHGAVVSKDFPIFDIDRSRVDPRFLLGFMKSPRLRAEVQAHSLGATNRQRIPEEWLLGLPMPLPPLDDQRRIAAILDRADNVGFLHGRALERFGDAERALFLDCFGEPATWHERWVVGSVGDLVESVTYGSSLKADSEGEWPILRMGNLTMDGRLDLGDLKYLDLPERDVDKHTVRRGDVLFNRTNSADLVGKTAVVNTDRPLAYAGYLIRVRLVPEHRPEFLAGYLNSSHGKAVLRHMSRSIVGQANINAKELQTIGIALPPTHVQDSYVKRLRGVEGLRQIAERRAEALDAFKITLQDRAFRGEL